MKYFVTGGSGFIGTNLIDDLRKAGHEVLNVDIKEPNVGSHRPFWKEVDILDAASLTEAMNAFSPSHVIHLAARTDTDGTELRDYTANTTGTKNVLDAVNSTPSVERLIVTSTQYVNQDGPPKDEFDYAPHTVYGESKVITEQFTRSAGLKCVWTIIRPTNIWGPWHKRYPHEFWRVLSRGLYVHPGKERVVRSYGYVKNVTHQITQIFSAKADSVAAKVFYVGDHPIDLLDWVNGFSMAQIGRKVRIVPRAVVRVLAKTGDLFKAAGITFPITSSRYRSMTSNNGVPMEATLDAFGPSPYTLQSGIRETVAWMREVHPHLVTRTSGG